jgi:translation elongation factor EF-G
MTKNNILMANKYVNFISDEHFLQCVANLHTAYLKAKNNVSKKSFFTNKVDTMKLTFDAKFNDLDQESLIQAEVLRQIDKSINNSIGTFHEQILGGIDGFVRGDISGYDVKAEDNTLFAFLNFEPLSQKIEECIFEKISQHAQIFRKAKYYFVDSNLPDDFCEKWVFEREEYQTSHKSVFKISLPKFYALLTNQDDAFLQIENKLEEVLSDYFVVI